jgi:hypothetical protein
VLGFSYGAKFVSTKKLRQLEDATNDDYVFPSPFLTCMWSQEEDSNGVGPIIQSSCDYVVPNVTDNEGGDPFIGYWIQSRCLWEETHQYSVIDCNVTDSYSLYI